MEEEKTLPALKRYLGMDYIQEKLRGLSEDSETFTSSLVSIVSENKMLMNCEPQSIIQSALKSATLHLPIDKNLGYAYIVPYGKQAQFQLGYKGLIQLALRSKEYKTIYATDVYADEMTGFNPITNEVMFSGSTGLTGLRYNGGQPVGYYALLKTKSGFRQSSFMTRAQVDEYAKKYSQAYQCDVREKKRSSPWSTEFDAMARKTVLKILLKTYGILTPEFRDGIISDDEPQPSDDQKNVTDITPVKVDKVKRNSEPQPEQELPEAFA